MLHHAGFTSKNLPFPKALLPFSRASVAGAVDITYGADTLFLAPKAQSSNGQMCITELVH